MMDSATTLVPVDGQELPLFATKTVQVDSEMMVFIAESQALTEEVVDMPSGARGNAGEITIKVAKRTASCGTLNAPTTSIMLVAVSVPPTALEDSKTLVFLVRSPTTTEVSVLSPLLALVEGKTMLVSAIPLAAMVTSVLDLSAGLTAQLASRILVCNALQTPRL
jgi:hypothetical protein